MIKSLLCTFFLSKNFEVYIVYFQRVAMIYLIWIYISIVVFKFHNLFIYNWDKIYGIILLFLNNLFWNMQFIINDRKFNTYAFIRLNFLKDNLSSKFSVI